MDKVIEQIDSLIEKTNDYAVKVDSDISNRQNDFRSMCFWNIHNRVLMTKEILTFYSHGWSQDGTEDGHMEELTERIMTVTRNMFTDIVSSAEKCVKDATYAYKMTELREKASLQSDYLYLRHIVTVSKDTGYIDREQMIEWNNILMIRNLAVHNNSEADRSLVLMMDGLRISMRPNRMMKGPLTTFITLSEKTVQLLYDWLSSVDKAVR